MTVYCNYVWKVDADTEPRDLLTQFAREHFHAHEAVPSIPPNMALIMA